MIENIIKNNIVRSDVMRVIANVLDILLISSMLYTVYPQYMCINSEIVENKKISVDKKIIKKDLDYLKEDINMPTLVGGKEEKNINLINSVIYKDILPKVEDAEKSAKAQFGGLVQENPTFPYEIKSIYTVTTNNNQLISLYNDYYEYLGGAHGITIRTSYTIDKNKEKIIILKELFNPGYDYNYIINKEIRSRISENPDFYFDSGNVFKGIYENQSFYIDKEDLVIYYQLYDIAPYVSGIPEFRIPLKIFGGNFIYNK